MSQIKCPVNVKQQFATDWLPTIAWIREGNGWHTNLAFAPSMVTTGPDVFKMELRFYEKGEFRGTFETAEVRSGQTLRVSVKESIQSLGLSQLDGLAEVIIRGHGPWSDQRRIKCVMDVWMEIASEDGRFRVVGPTGQFAGSNRVRVPSDLAYESYPGIPLNEKFTTDLLLINPYTMPVWHQISLVTPNGRKIDSERKSLFKRSASVYPLKEIVPGFSRIQNDSDVFSLIVASKFKLIAFCLFRNVVTGETTALDHTWPFLEFRRD